MREIACMLGATVLFAAAGCGGDSIEREITTRPV